MTELARIRSVYDAIEEPTDKTISTARQALLREIGSVESLRPSRSRRRRAIVGIAAAILVCGVLVTPAIGIGDRLLDLIQSAPGRPDVQAPVWSPGGGRIAFLNRRDGGKEVYVVNADGSGQRRLARDGDTPAWSPDGRRIAFESGRVRLDRRLRRERRRKRAAEAGAQRGHSCLVS